MVATAAERQLAAVITDAAQQYRQAVASRRAALAAADRFYRDLVVYQWRLDAIDAQLEAADVAAGEPGADAEAADSRRRLALRHSLEAIREQRRLAVAALEDRAAHYAVGETGATGRVERLATSKAARQRALALLREAAHGTFEEISNEAEEILQVAPGAAGLAALRSALERRRRFWQGQLEETWAAWQEATGKMHQAGDEALAAWSSGAQAVARALGSPGATGQAEASPAAPVALGTAVGGGGSPRLLPQALLQALAVAAARGLEVEILDPLGLAGLHVERNGEEAFTADSRLAVLLSVLDALRAAEALPRLADALLPAAGAWAASLADRPASTPTTPEGEDQAAASTLEPWLAETLVEALCEAARAGDGRRARLLLELCHAFGGDALVDAVRGAESQAPSRRGQTPPEVAHASGHPRVARLLEEWPLLETPRDSASCRAPEDATLGKAAVVGAGGGPLDWLTDWRPNPTYAKWVHRAWLGSLL